MKLELRQRVAAPADEVWPLLVDPPKMNRWSLARIDLLAAGDGGHPGGVGAMRRVTVKSMRRSSSFDEVIEASEGPHRLVYRVIRGLPLRDHRGVITLRPSPGAPHVTDLTWSVDYDFLVPLLGLGARVIVASQLESSLRALARVAEDAHVHRAGRASFAPPPLAPERHVDAGLDVGPLWAEATRILERQTHLADRLDAEGDPKAWFTRVYQFVTENQLAFCKSGRVTHPAWVLHLIPRFHHYYVDNLLRARAERSGPTEEHWRVAFRAMERGRTRLRDQGVAVAWGILRGAQAHIEEDLPRALADVYLDHYAEQCDYARFRADYVLMAAIFRDASRRIVARMPPSYLPAWVRAVYPVLPVEVQDAVFRRQYYDVPRQRLRAFERGERLAAWRSGRRPLPEAGAF